MERMWSYQKVVKTEAKLYSRGVSLLLSLAVVKVIGAFSSKYR